MPRVWKTCARGILKTLDWCWSRRREDDACQSLTRKACWLATESHIAVFKELKRAAVNWNKSSASLFTRQTRQRLRQHWMLNAYNSGGNGAHFLIGKDGHIYQTANLLQTCYHVGKLIKSKCLEIDASRPAVVTLIRQNCSYWRGDNESKP